VGRRYIIDHHARLAENLKPDPLRKRMIEAESKAQYDEFLKTFALTRGVIKDPEEACTWSSNGYEHSDFTGTQLNNMPRNKKAIFLKQAQQELQDIAAELGMAAPGPERALP
jgi:hypothetical protein